MKFGWATEILKGCFPRALPEEGRQPQPKEFTLFRAGVKEVKSASPRVQAVTGESTASEVSRR